MKAKQIVQKNNAFSVIPGSDSGLKCLNLLVKSHGLHARCGCSAGRMKNNCTC